MDRKCAVFLLVAIVPAACGTSSRAVRDDRPPDLPPTVTATSTGAEIRLSNPDQGVMRDVAAAPSAVFAAVVDVLKDFDIEPAVVDPRGRQLSVERLTRTQIAGRRSDALVRCGNEGAGPSAASRFRITFDWVTRVVAEGSGSVLHTRLQASARPVDGSSIGQVACVSTGELEERIYEGVALKLGIRSSGGP